MIVLTKVGEELVRQVIRIGECGVIEWENASSATSSGGSYRHEQSARSSVADMTWVGVDQKRTW